jgi:hypothetical protein
MAFNFEQELAINKNKLDDELLTQAQKMMRYNSAHAQAMYDRDRAKQALDVTKANLDASIRAELTASGAKFTEAVVDGKIRTSSTYIEAQDKYQKAEHEVNLLLGAVMAMNARKGMLESLVKLFLSGYWSEPRVPGGEAMKAGAVVNAVEESVARGTGAPGFQPTDWPKEAPVVAPPPAPGTAPPRMTPTPRPVPKKD